MTYAYRRCCTLILTLTALACDTGRNQSASESGLDAGSLHAHGDSSMADASEAPPDAHAPYADAASTDAAADPSDGGKGGAPTALIPESCREGFASGTRLKARYLESNGIRSFVGFHDSQLKVDCVFTAASDGTLRCLPPKTLFETLSVFEDDKCSEPALAVATPLSLEPGVVQGTRLDSTLQCEMPEPEVLLRVGEPFAAGDRYYSQGGTCTPIVAAALVYRAATPLAVTDFVKAHLASGGDDNAALTAVGLVAEDGACVVEAAYDQTHDVPCQPAGIAGYGSRCLPAPLVRWDVGVHADAKCAEPAVVVAESNPETVPGNLTFIHPPYRFAYSLTPGLCFPGPRVSPSIFPVGEAFSGIPAGKQLTQTYYEEEEFCPQALEGRKGCSGWTAYTATDPVSPEIFPAISLKASGDGRLRPYRYEAPGLGAAINISPVIWRDTKLDLDCHAVTINGRTLCVPVKSSGGYLKVTCDGDKYVEQSYVTNNYLDERACDVEYAVVDGDVIELTGESHQVTTHFRLANGDCSPDEEAPQVYKVKKSVLQDLAELTRGIEGL